MNTMQSYWDACLIKTWRLNVSLYDTMTMFTSITGKKVSDIEPPLLRIPLTHLSWKVGVRVFVASNLEKISNRLWEQPPEKDVALLAKLQTSKYTTSTQVTNTDRELNNQRSQYKRNRTKVGMSTLAVNNRNSDTDWNVVKGASRVKARRR